MGGFIAALLLGGYKIHKGHKQRKKWFQTVMSIVGTAFISFTGTWGAVGGEMLLVEGADPWVALAGGFFSGLLAMSAMVVVLWKRNPMTKDIPIAFPMRVSEEVLDSGHVYTESAKGEKK